MIGFFTTADATQLAEVRLRWTTYYPARQGGAKAVEQFGEALERLADEDEQ